MSNVHIFFTEADTHEDLWCPYCDEILPFGHQYYYILGGIMGAKSARLYNYNQAKRVANCIGRIINRINRKYCPGWMKKELDEAYHQADCIVQERERAMRDYGDEI